MANEFETLIGENSSLKGDLRFRGGLFVDGEVDGSVIALDENEGTLKLSDRGTIKGEVKVPHAVINGRIEGDLTSSGRIELQENAKVEGNIYYRSIQMSLGAQVNGQLVHQVEGAKRLSSPAPSATAKASKGKDGSSVETSASTPH